jgi:NTP pyrophosphatase (non-canonical NTP hydrolase)
MSDLVKLRDSSRRREWDQFHSPKNLAIALSIEAAELLEPFQWLSEEAPAALPAASRTQVEEEMADVAAILRSASRYARCGSGGGGAAEVGRECRVAFGRQGAGDEGEGYGAVRGELRPENWSRATRRKTPFSWDRHGRVGPFFLTGEPR